MTDSNPFESLFKQAQELTKAFRHRNTRKIYWTMLAGVPKPKQGRISTFLARSEGEERGDPESEGLQEGPPSESPLCTSQSQPCHRVPLTGCRRNRTGSRDGPRRQLRHRLWPPIAYPRW